MTQCAPCTSSPGLVEGSFLTSSSDTTRSLRKLWEGEARGPGHAKALYLSGAGAAADMSKGDDKDVDESLPELEAMPLWDYEVSRGHVWTP